MSFFPKAPEVIGIETTAVSFKIALLKKKRKGWQVQRLEEVPIDVNLLDRVPKEATLATALHSKEILVRPLELPLKKEKDIESAYEFQAEPLLPYPLEKAILQKINIKSHVEGTLLTLLAVKKEHLERHIHFFNERHLDPMVVTGLPMALSNIASHLPNAEEPQLLLHLDKEEGTVVLVEGGKLLASRAFEKEKSEIEKSILALLGTYKYKKIHSLLLISDDPSDVSLVEQATKLTVVLPKIPFVSEEALQKYGVALGIAFAATDKTSPNFRAKENNFSLQWKRVKKPLFTYLTLAFLLFATLLSFEKKLLEEQEQLLLKRSSSLLQEMPSHLEELCFKIEKMESEIQKIPDTFPLLPQTPKVKDILASLSSDPRLFTEKGASLIEIEDFRYVMTSRPDFDRRNEKYQVKVEMTFTATSPESAHAFHESLLSPNHPFVDGKKEVEWMAGKGKYKACFYLKDKTRYS
jgi:type IV pilus assembly protein PilM